MLIVPSVGWLWTMLLRVPEIIRFPLETLVATSPPTRFAPRDGVLKGEMTMDTAAYSTTSAPSLRADALMYLAKLASLGLCARSIHRYLSLVCWPARVLYNCDA